ncbi:hypothetical protein KBD20_00365 [Candidatus Saccharibacteria bacterium]|nr:hypothetical protein [Candidatus Saccharibacteria bacterium]
MLPGLAPHHTRQSFCSGSRLYIENVISSPDDFLQHPDTGLWLLPESVAERDRSAGEKKLGELALVQKHKQMKDWRESTRASRILANTAITEIGCMVGGADSEPETNDPAQLAIYFADREWVPVLDEPTDLPHLNICGTEGCYNTRHYNLDFGRDRSTELNPNWFSVSDDGGVETIWGDQLASVEESLLLFTKFQRKHYPFIPYSESVLTAAGVAYVGFHPLTGCWESWSYNRKPEGSKGGRFEGYGNLYVRFRAAGVDHETGEITNEKRRGNWLAHRTMWWILGNDFVSGTVLNHRCNYKRCCNPLHLEQVTDSFNVRHGLVAQEAIKALPDQQIGSFLSAREYAEQYEKVRILYNNIA